MAHKRINDAGNVAIELVIAVALTVTFVLPSAVYVSDLFRSRIEALDAVESLSRTFQVTPYESLKINMTNIRVLLQRESKNDLKIFLQYSTNSDGITDSVKISAISGTSILGLKQIEFQSTAKRANFVS